MCDKNCWVVKSVDPQKVLHATASALGLYHLLKPVFLNTKGKSGAKSKLSLETERQFWKAFWEHFLMEKSENISIRNSGDLAPWFATSN